MDTLQKVNLNLKGNSFIVLSSSSTVACL